MTHLYTSSLPLLHIFARGGGGGSGGGGGGGGGGIIALIGYVPAHFVSSWCNRHLSRKVGIIAGSIVGLAVTVPCIYVSPFFGILVGIGAAVGVYSGINNLLSRALKLAKTAHTAAQVAANSDPVWQEEAIQSRIKKVFLSFQHDWSTFNLPHIRTYTTDNYYNHVRLMLTAIYQMGRRNNVETPVLNKALVTQVVDQHDNNQDSFQAYIAAQAHDIQVDTVHNQIIYTDDSAFEEFWRFRRIDNEWMLDGIQQATANLSQRQLSLQNFAAQVGMYYSLDWGWLLLPQRGLLFSNASFKNSDVNNHVIGEWNGLIVQLYTYIPVKATRSADNYLIGQINLPKSYGGIIIKKRSRWSWLSQTPTNYKKVSFEWPDFNKRYLVYATNAEQVTAFELLNPGFMAKLYDSALPINIEVVDNLVYFYSRVSDADHRYGDMLAILVDAHKELRL